MMYMDVYRLHIVLSIVKFRNVRRCVNVKSPNKISLRVTNALFPYF
jgi:hypothetical protein